MSENLNAKLLKALIAQSEYNIEIFNMVGALAKHVNMQEVDPEFLDAIKTAQSKATGFVEAISQAISAMKDSGNA